MSMTAPNIGGRCAAWRRLVLLCMYRCLQFRLRAMAEREVLSALLDDFAFSPLPLRGASLAKTSGRYGTSGLVADTPEINASSGN